MIKQLSPTDLWAVKIPVDATECTIKFVPETSPTENNHTIPLNIITRSIVRVFANNDIIYAGYLPKGEFEYLGLVTKDEVLFDASPYASFKPYFNNAADSLYSLLTANKTGWINPWGDKPKEEDYEHGGIGTDGVEIDIFEEEMFNERMKNWQAAENNLIGNNNLLILKKLK